MKPMLLTVIFLIIFCSNVQAQFAGGNGTALDPYQVETVEQLQNIHDDDYRALHFIQIADIDASGTAVWNGGEGFVLIHPFVGTYDGNGFVISDLTINRPGENFMAFAGRLRERGVIRNTVLVNISVTGSSNTAAFAGQNHFSYIIDSYATGNVSGNGHRVGGLVGWSGHGNVESSYAIVDVTNESDRATGGLVGFKFGTGSLVDNSYAQGTVTGANEDGGDVGGLVGEMASGLVTHSYASGEVIGAEAANLGGLIGNNGSTVASSYWDIEATGQSDGAGRGSTVGMISLTTSEMTGTNAYHNMNAFDFEETTEERWLLTEGYPALFWEDVDALEIPVSADSEELPVAFELQQNYPNPFNPTTSIRYAVPQTSHVTIQVFSVTGQLVATLVIETCAEGYHEVAFDGTKLASGVYIYRMQASDFVMTRKLTLVK